MSQSHKNCREYVLVDDASMFGFSNKINDYFDAGYIPVDPKINSINTNMKMPILFTMLLVRNKCKDCPNKIPQKRYKLLINSICGSDTNTSASASYAVIDINRHFNDWIPATICPNYYMIFEGSSLKMFCVQLLEEK